jgi:hypothetical protein
MTEELVKVHRQEEKQGLQLTDLRDQWCVEEEELQVPEQCEANMLHDGHHNQTPCLFCSC